MIGIFLLTGGVRLIYAFDLVTAYQDALAYNADYLVAVARNLADQESQVQARSTLLPQISGQGSLNENYLNSGMSLFYHQPLASLQLQQVVFDFSKFSRYTKGKFATKLADLQLADTKQQLMITVAQAYFDVLAATDNLAAISMSKESLNQQLKQAQSSFSVGKVTITDVNDAQAGFDKAHAQEIQAQNDLINKRNILHNLTGLNSELLQPLVQNIDLVTPLPANAEQWSNLAQTNNLKIKIANMQVAMAGQDVSIAKAGHIPSVNVTGAYQYQGAAGVDSADAKAQAMLAQSANVPGTFLSSYSSAKVGVGVNLPIYSGGAISSQVRQAMSMYAATKQQLVAVQRQTDQNIRNAFWQVENGVAIVKAQTQALKSAKVKLSSDQIGYQVGIRTSIDLVNSEMNYSKAIQDYNNSRYQYLIARLKLKYLAGEINGDFLKLINANIKH
jgi:outer membrane protein